METVVKKIEQKKHLGQYFSGNSIASLLANLAGFTNAKTIIDPMCGTGDMLAACNPSKYSNKSYFGIEIDDDVWNLSLQRFQTNQNVNLIHGNSFHPKILRALSTIQYDLVITNPPYVRYQTIATNKINTPEYLNTSEIKQNLIISLSNFKHLDTKDKEQLKLLISNYSGLSDLAVPSWILCALITKVGGHIAMVVPQTWLTREYATVIHYLLLRWFRIEYIVEDGNSVWFPKAQIKTTLIVAKRIKRKESILSWKNESFTYCKVFSEAINDTSLVGRIFPGNSNPEKSFTKIIKKPSFKHHLFTKSNISLALFAKDLKLKAATLRWYKSLEPRYSKVSIRFNSVRVPSDLSEWLENHTPALQSLSDLGVNVSQGLRTGANIFFYLDIVKHTKQGMLSLPQKPFEQKPILIPSQFYKEVIRKQSDLDESYSVSNYKPRGIVLSLQHGICSEDISSLSRMTTKENNYQLVPSQLNKHIQEAALTNIGNESRPKYIPTLSAVRPNTKLWNPSKPDELPRYWYMLPEFTRRHYPDLFIPRVNSQHPLTRLNNKRYLIDANFSTVWISDANSKFNNYTLLAFFNSSWSIIAMEEYGTVMGGGALKLEANQIKKLPIPILNNISTSKLTLLGEQLTQNKNDYSKIINKIDIIILESLGFEQNCSEKLKSLNLLKNKILKQRTGK